MMPDVVDVTLRKMRDTLLHDPQILLEGWGGPTGARTGYFYADVFGFEDELLDEFLPVDHAMPVLLKPIREKITLAPFNPDLWAGPRVAEFGLRSGYARAAVSSMYLPDWKHDDQFLVHLNYIRYKRRS